MSAACVSVPVSWLRLERYSLDQLEAGERAEVDAHVAGCPACSECLEQLGAEDVELLPLPALPSAAPTAPSWRPWLRWGGVGSLVVAAAVMLLVVLVGRDSEPDTGFQRDSRAAIKGGELAIDLLRLHRGSTATDPRVFVDGDRFSVLLTCPPGHGYRPEITVEQAAVVARPIAIHADFGCGNRVTLDGGFRVTGDQPVRVCAELGGTRVCLTITAAGQ